MAHGDVTCLELLRLYLQSCGNQKVIAWEGFLGRPTLYARLARLEDLFGANMAAAESRTSLHVALMLPQLRKVWTHGANTQRRTTPIKSPCQPAYGISTRSVLTDDAS
ncbi:helix-turn-helix domain-containing protein [Arthrobacter sp. HLT1-20]